jgi:dihydroorotase
VDADAKDLPFAEAQPGATGLELLWSLAMKWGQESGVDLMTVLSRITARPAQVLGAALSTLQGSVGQLAVGGAADVVVLSDQGHWPVANASLQSQCKSTPFSGYELPGRVCATLVGGHIAFEAS